MIVETGRLVIGADEDGRIGSVALSARPDRPVLAGVDLGPCRVGGVEVAWRGREMARDADEVSVRAVAGALDVQLRHSFSTGWTTRLLLVNTGTAALTVDRLELTARPGPEQRLSALAAGSRLCWAVQAEDGNGPLLTARLTTGAVSRVTEHGFELGPLRLSPGQRYVTQLRWELLATPRSVVAGPGRDVLVSRTAYETGEALLLPADPDAALVVPAGVAVDPVDEPDVAGREVTGYEPGRHRVELRSAEGDLRLELAWVEPLADQLQQWAEALLDGPRTAAGVVVLDDLSAAIVLQAALGTDQLSDPDAAADALDRLTAQLLDREGPTAPDPLAVLYLLGEHGRTGDPDVLELALSLESALLESTLLAADTAPPPGLGLAVLRTALAGVDAPERVAPLLRRAVERVSLAAEPTESSIEAYAAELELLLAVRPLLPPDHAASGRLAGLVRRLGAAVGAGLPGRLVSPPPVAEHAHLLAVLRLLPEEGIAGATRTWGASPTLLVHRVTLEVLDRTAGSPVGPAAAWLALGQRHD